MTERMTENELTDIADYITYRKEACSAPYNERDNIGTMGRMLTEIRTLRSFRAKTQCGELVISRTDEEGYTLRGLTHTQARGLDLLISCHSQVQGLTGSQRIELEELLGVMLPVLGGMTDTNTTKGAVHEVQ